MAHQPGYRFHLVASVEVIGDQSTLPRYGPAFDPTFRVRRDQNCPGGMERHANAALEVVEKGTLLASDQIQQLNAAIQGTDSEHPAIGTERQGVNLARR